MGHWLKRLGIASLFAFPLAVILYRLNLASFDIGFLLIQFGGLVAVVTFLVGIGYFLAKRNSNAEGAKAALIGAVIALIPAVPLLMQAKKATTLPFIHNISTDTVNAPEFDKILSIRTEQDNPHAYDPTRQIGEAGKLGDLQTAAYPNVKTLSTGLSAQEALTKAESIAKSMGWEIINVDADKGIVEATETTLLWGFKDDVVVRITQSGANTLVDLKSVSRYGGSDLGANAARIEAFLERFSD